MERTAHPTGFFPCQACWQVGRRSPRALGLGRKNGTVLTWILGIATTVGGFAAVAYFWDKWRDRRDRRKWTEKEKHRYREQLAAFLTEAHQLRTRLDEVPLPIGEHNAWVDRVGEYLRDNLGKAYEARFSDFSGMKFLGDGSDRSRMSRSIEGRSRRLTEFMSELSR